METFFWATCYPKSWNKKGAKGWIFEPNTVSYTRKEAISKCVAHCGIYTWGFLFRNGRRCGKVTINDFKGA